jgi:phenylacetate-CoA ligase
MGLLGYKLIDIFTDRQAVKKLGEIKKLERLGLEELKNIQNSKLCALIDFIYENNRFYRDIFDSGNLKPSDIRRAEDLIKLPVLNKKIILENYDKLKSDGWEERGGRFKATSGSTGASLTYIIDKETHSWVHGYLLHSWITAGYRPGEKVLTIGGGMIKSGKLKRKIFSILRNSIDYSSFNFDENKIIEIIEIINGKKIGFIYGYSSSLALIAKYALEKNIALHSPAGIVTTAENLLPHNRERIEKAFRTKIFDQYGVMDGGITAYQCEKHEGYHIGMTKGIVETVNDAGEPVFEETGRIISTDLDNYSFPFIRYESGDIGVKTKKQCGCGRGFELLASIEGRTREFLTTKNGKKIHGAIFSYIVRENPWINQYQIYQKEAGKIILRIVSGENIDDAKKETVKSFVRKNCPDGMDIEVVQVDDIPMSANNKRHFVISEIKNI